MTARASKSRTGRPYGEGGQRRRGVRGRATRGGSRSWRGCEVRTGKGWKGWQAGRQARHTLGAEAVEGAALALEGVDDVEGGDRLALRVLGVSDRVADDVCRGGGDDGEVSDWLPTSSRRGSPQAGGEGRRTLEEDLEDTPGLLVDEARDPLDTTTACQTADRRLGDALDVVTQDLPGSIGRESHGVSRAAANDRRGPTMRSTTRKGGGPHLAVTLGAALAESLASLSAARHSC